MPDTTASPDATAAASAPNPYATPPPNVSMPPQQGNPFGIFGGGGDPNATGLLGLSFGTGNGLMNFGANTIAGSNQRTSFGTLANPGILGALGYGLQQTMAQGRAANEQQANIANKNALTLGQQWANAKSALNYPYEKAVQDYNLKLLADPAGAAKSLTSMFPTLNAPLPPMPGTSSGSSGDSTGGGGDTTPPVPGGKGASTAPAGTIADRNPGAYTEAGPAAPPTDEQGQPTATGLAALLPGYMRTTAQYESGGDATKKNPNSSAQGVYQITDATYQNTVNNHPELAGLSWSDPRIMEALTEDNAKFLQNSLGRSPGLTDLTMAHFFGPTGATHILSGDPNAAITSAISPEAYNANKSVLSHPDGTPKTIGEVYAMEAQHNHDNPNMPGRAEAQARAFSLAGPPNTPAPEGAGSTAPGSTAPPAGQVANDVAAIQSGRAGAAAGGGGTQIAQAGSPGTVGAGIAAKPPGATLPPNPGTPTAQAYRTWATEIQRRAAEVRQAESVIKQLQGRGAMIAVPGPSADSLDRMAEQALQKANEIEGQQPTSAAEQQQKIETMRPGNVQTQSGQEINSAPVKVQWMEGPIQMEGWVYPGYPPGVAPPYATNKPPLMSWKVGLSPDAQQVMKDVSAENKAGMDADQTRINEGYEKIQERGAAQTTALQLRDISPQVASGWGGNFRAGMQNFFETMLPGKVSAAFGVNATPAQLVRKLSVTMAGNQAQANLGTNAGVEASKMWTEAVPNLDLQNLTNGDVATIIAIQLQAGTDYDRGLGAFGNKNIADFVHKQSDYYNDNSKGLPEYQRISNFDQTFRSIYTPRVYTAAMMAATGQDAATWEKFLTPLQIKAVVGIVQRVDPSITMKMGVNSQGKVVAQQAGDVEGGLDIEDPNLPNYKPDGTLKAPNGK